MNEKTYTIDVPRYLQIFVGAAKVVVIPVHTIGSCLKKGGLVLVYEPRRDCEYWLKQSDVYKPPSKTWEHEPHAPSDYRGLGVAALNSKAINGQKREPPC